MAKGLTGAGSTYAWRQRRLSILSRDGYRCQIPDPATGALCLAPATHVDHIVPRVAGGSEDPSNLRAACQTCNLRRGAGAEHRAQPRGRSGGPWRKVRATVLERDGGLCRWPSSTAAGDCLAPATTVVHVVLPSAGGTEHDPANLRAACRVHAAAVYRAAAVSGGITRRAQAGGASIDDPPPATRPAPAPARPTPLVVSRPRTWSW